MPLTQRVERQLDRAVDPAIAAFAQVLAEKAGAVAALFYGSNLRTGELAGVLDFYLLMPGPQIDRIWPRVSYHEWDYQGITLRAKVATMPISLFHDAASGFLRDTTIWARFVQPSGLVWRRDDSATGQIVTAIEAAIGSAARFAAALGPKSGSESDFWRALFQETYKAEFRVEKSGREDSILSLNRDHFDGLLPLAWQHTGIEFCEASGALSVDWRGGEKDQILRQWRSKRRWGKPLNVIRLLKASTTFEGAARYAGWKIERHTGVPVEITPWREKHPVLAAPGVLFSVWKAKRRRS